MKKSRRLVVDMLGEILADMTDARDAIAEGRLGVALAKLELVSARLRDASKELRSL